ncbi:MAG: hypothetical protein WA985_13170 [Erythrobacter sp.]
MNGWRTVQLTHGTEEGRFHSHSYYDIPVFDASGTRVVAHRMTMQGRTMRPDDRVEVGIVDVERPGSFEPVARTSAWSWQQGPLAQWVGGGPQIVFNTRQKGRFRARLHDVSTGKSDLLPRSVYAVAGDGETFFGLNMRRLEHLRPGYGYATRDTAPVLEKLPRDDGIWRMKRDGEAILLVSIAQLCRAYLENAPLSERLRHRLGGYTYWLNHLKLSPDGARFTVKLRWRRPEGPWSDRQSASMTGGMNGTGLRTLAKGLSHVMWLNSLQLYAWQQDRLVLIDDDGPDGAAPATLAPGLITQNVHLRHLPPGASETLNEAVFDTPYRETVDLVHYRAGNQPGSAQHERIASFAGHVPARGALRCDLHPCPSPDGRRFLVTSLSDGGRQLYLVERDHP